MTSDAADTAEPSPPVLQRRPHRLLIGGLLVVVLAVTAGVVALVTRDDVQHLEVGARGGMLTPDDLGVRVEVPADAAPDGTSVAFSPTDDAIRPPLDFVQPLGGYVEIKPDAPLPGATVRFTVPDLPQARTGARRTEPTDLFVAVYDPVVQTWEPLASTYDSGTREMTAVAPHFSVYGVFASVPGTFDVVRERVKTTIEVGKDAASSGVGAIVQAATASVNHVWETVYGDDPLGSAAADIEGRVADDKRIDRICTADPVDSWRAESTSDKVTGCVTTVGAVYKDAGTPVPTGVDGDAPHLLLQADRRLSYDVFPKSNPTWVTGEPNSWDTEIDDTPQLFNRGLHAAVGGTFVPGPGRQQVALPPDLDDDFDLLLTPNWLVVVLDVIEAALIMTPQKARANAEFKQKELDKLNEDIISNKVEVHSEDEMFAELDRRVSTRNDLAITREFELLRCAVDASREFGRALALEETEFRKAVLGALDCAKIVWTGSVSTLKQILDPLEGLVSAGRGIQAFRQFYVHGRDPVTINGRRQLSTAEARALPARKLNPDDVAECSRTGKRSPAGAPAGGRICAVDVDLDGNDKVDRLLVWQGGDRFGATAYLDDGRQVVMDDPPPFENFSVEFWRPWVVVKDVDGIRDALAVQFTFGSSTEWGAVLMLTTEDRLRVVENPDGKGLTVHSGGAVSYSSGFGCVRSGTDFYLAQSDATHDATTPADYPGKNWTMEVFRVRDGIATPLNRHLAGYNIQGGGWPVFMKGRFCQGLREDLGRLADTPGSPAASVRSVLAAVTQNNEALGRAVIDGSYAPYTDDLRFSADVWSYLADSVGTQYVRNWVGRPVSCPGSGSPRECEVIAADGYVLWLMMAELPKDAGGGWVVTGVSAGGG